MKLSSALCYPQDLSRSASHHGSGSQAPRSWLTLRTRSHVSQMLSDWRKERDKVPLARSLLLVKESGLQQATSKKQIASWQKRGLKPFVQLATIHLLAKELPEGTTYETGRVAEGESTKETKSGVPWGTWMRTFWSWWQHNNCPKRGNIYPLMKLTFHLISSHCFWPYSNPDAADTWCNSAVVTSEGLAGFFFFLRLEAALGFPQNKISTVFILFTPCC